MLLLTASWVHPQVSRSLLVPSTIRGTWVIYKFTEVGGHAGETIELAQAQIGRTLRIGRLTFEHDKDALWFGHTPCKNARYMIETHKNSQYDVGDKGSLGFYGLEPAESDRDEFLVVSCAKRAVCTLEFARNHELAVYYDGWFFFLKQEAKDS